LDKEIKLIRWLGDTKKVLKNLPDPVQKDIGDALYDVQTGETPPSSKPLTGIGSGIYEIVDRYDKDTYRAVYAVKLGNYIYVLHVFKKKSKQGISTPKEYVKIIKQRYKEALGDFKSESKEKENAKKRKSSK